MMAMSAAWSGIAGVAVALSLVAIAGMVYAIAVLWRLRRDWRTLQAAGQLDLVNLAPVLKNHLQAEFRSDEPTEKFPIVRQGIDRKIARWKLVAVTFGAVALGAGGTASLLISRNMQAIAVARPPIDALKVIAGVWGWRYNALQSCQENPLTMTLTADGRKLSARFAKPIWNGKNQVQTYEYDITGSQPNTLLLSPSNANPLLNDRTDPWLHWSIVFENADTYIMRRGDIPIDATGEIARCH